MNKARVREVHKAVYKKGVVLLALGRDIRARDNDALIYAATLAKEHNVNLLVSITLWPTFTGSSSRYYDFFFEGLQETEKILRSHNIPLVVTIGREDETLENLISTEDVGFLVTDFLPLRFSKNWKRKLSEKIKIPWHEVDAHNIIPPWVTSDKKEFAARTIRPKIHKLLPEFLEEYEDVPRFTDTEFLSRFLLFNEQTLREKLTIKKVEKSAYLGGESAGLTLLTTFFETKLENYSLDRNDMAKDGQSNLSPYIARGMLSRRRIAIEIIAKSSLTFPKLLEKSDDKPQNPASMFLEELIVRAELAENFCYFEENYDNLTGAATWARETLNRGSSDKRDHTYTKEDFEKAATHDELWNAAQRQMVETGKMHGYMRMYWAKKILEWTKSAEEAVSIANYLNDTYELDGLDPNGYVGTLWSIGGLHDRPWFARPIFGLVRYMARSGAEKQGNVVDYIKLWNQKK